jgi:hypothetical protein
MKVFAAPSRTKTFAAAVVSQTGNVSGFRLVLFLPKNAWLRERIIDVAFDDARLKQVEFSIEKQETFLAAFDASLFQSDWSGRLEFRFKTPTANQLLAFLRQTFVIGS